MKPEERVPMEDARNLDTSFLPEGETFDLLISKRQAAKATIKKCEELIEDVDTKMGTVLDLNKRKNVVWNNELVVSRREPSAPRKSVDPQKLLDLGVAAHIIKEATVEGKPGKLGIVVRKVTREEEGKSDKG